ncbi:MAG: efflux RND transporter periplasmic adaptor subunit [Acidobacteriota bacterium]|nr:MAG: efflux RND transporter periplasmic adaptor subunit [Acidobacteriota bacterium]
MKTASQWTTDIGTGLPLRVPEPVRLTALAVLLLIGLSGGWLGCAASGSLASSAESSQQDQASAAAEDARSDAAKEPSDDEQDETAIPVEIAAIGSGAIESVLRFSTHLEAEEAVGVFARSSGLVREISVEEGARVAAGDLLAKLEDDDQKNAVAKARIELDQARREHERQERLFEQQLISEQAFNAATSDLERLEIVLEDAERALTYTEIRAPIRGTVTERLVRLGEKVSPEQHLFDLVDFDSLVARVFVPEKNLAELAVGLQTRISSQAVPDRRYHGAVSRISPVVDPRSGTIKVTVGVGQQPGLRPGMYVDVALVTARRTEAILLPKRALVYDGEQQFVYRLKDDDDEQQVERVLVEPRLADRDFVEPVSGFAPGERIVVAGQAGLRDGAKVSLIGAERDAEERASAEGERDAEDARNDEGTLG